MADHPRTPSLVVLWPTTGRAHQLERVAQAFADVTDDYRMLFLVDDDDPESYVAAAMVDDVLFSPRTGFPAKVNHGIRHSVEPLIFLGSDDLKPHAGAKSPNPI
jgi:hypothetical protein